MTVDRRFPLHWPAGYPRCRDPQAAKFKVTEGAARDELYRELTKHGALGVVVSTNVPLGKSGKPYTGGDPDDPGVAVYFSIDGEEHVIACDEWASIRSNMRAIGLTLGAIRSMERWGSSALTKRVFSAFRMLPAAGKKPWREVLGLHELHGLVSTSEERAQVLDVAEEAYRRLARLHHPDAGGEHDRFVEINGAIEDAREELS